MNYKYLLFVVLLLALPLVSAVPTTGDATAISSNNFTVPVAGASGDVWISWGLATTAEPWGSGVYQENGDIRVYGAPLLGGSVVYYKACDSSGCGVIKTVNIPSVTPMPTTTFGNPYRNLTREHFAITSIAPNILPGYLGSGITPTLLWGIMFFFIFFGFWFRTRSVRLAIILGFIMAAFILTPTGGLFLGAPLTFQLVAQGLMAAAIAGILVGFIRK